MQDNQNTNELQVGDVEVTEVAENVSSHDVVVADPNQGAIAVQENPVTELVEKVEHFEPAIIAGAEAVTTNVVADVVVDVAEDIAETV